MEEMQRQGLGQGLGTSMPSPRTAISHISTQPPSLFRSKITSLTGQKTDFHSYHLGNSKGFRSSLVKMGIKTKYNSPPLSVGDAFQDLQQMPETMERAESYVDYTFQYNTYKLGTERD